MRAVAKEEKCALIDLNAMSRIFYQALGDESGQGVSGRHAPQQLRQLRTGRSASSPASKQAKLPLAKFIVDDFRVLIRRNRIDVNKFEMPASPNVSNEKPLGN